jgi:hypothetical protein
LEFWEPSQHLLEYTGKPMINFDNLNRVGCMSSTQQQLGILGTISAFAGIHRKTND